MLADTLLGSRRYTLDEAQDAHARLVALACVAAVEHGLDEVIFLRLVTVESSWNPNAENPVSGCLGLCQLNPRFYEGTRSELLEPKRNLALGAETLAANLKYWRGSYFLALVTFNFGIGNVLDSIQEFGVNWHKELPDETWLYVYRILLRPREE